MKLIQIILLIVGFVLIIGTSFGQTTASKELEGISQLDLNQKEIYNLAVENIVDCKTDLEVISTLNFYKELLNNKYYRKLEALALKQQPQLKNN